MTRVLRLMALRPLVGSQEWSSRQRRSPNCSRVMVRTILEVFHALQAAALVAHSSLWLAVVAPAGMTG